VNSQPPADFGTTRIRLGHLPFLDGIRGVAALYVVLHHFLAWNSFGLSRIEHLLVAWAEYGHFMVGVFIVLSGFCLSLPSAGAGNYTIRGGVLDYFLRRSKRILPPYFFALLLSIAVAFFLGNTKELTFNSLLTHTFLVHNWFPQYVRLLNMAHWSVATEWQIYFLLPFLFLPVWRRFGIIWVVIIGFFVGLIPQFIAPQSAPFDHVCPWYAGLFALGILGAHCATLASWHSGPWPRRLPLIAAGIGALYLVSKYMGLGMLGQGVFSMGWLMDAQAGGLSLALILFLVADQHRNQNQSSPPSKIVQVLSSRTLVYLGSISYSLYLTHCIVLNIVNGFWAPVLNPHQLLLVKAFIGVPACVILAVLCSYLVERPFIVRKSVLA
jgi:peptidoglycan/LPS O-acetylase OafA/YrhL